MELLTVVQPVDFSLSVVKIRPVALLVHVLMKSFLSGINVCSRPVPGNDTYEAMKFMVNVDGADVAIISGYPDTNVLTTKALYYFGFDTNVFICRDRQCRNGKMIYRYQADRTIQEIMPCLIQCGAWLSGILAFLLDSVSKSKLAFFPDYRFARRSYFRQQEKLAE